MLETLSVTRGFTVLPHFNSVKSITHFDQVIALKLQHVHHAFRPNEFYIYLVQPFLQDLQFILYKIINNKINLLIK